MLTFCTLFDENYLDKGLVLYDSLENVCEDDFRLYVLCMSDKCYNILLDINKDKIYPVSLSDFENEGLKKVKKARTKGEYCWTCNSFFIKYIIEKFHPEYCTYLDADMAFYDNPQVIIDEMVRRNASVSIVGHRFNKDVAEEMNRIYGPYCVECNTFKNDYNGRSLLNYWASQCLEYCSADYDGVHFGDQKYMDNWVRDYPFVIELENLGAGLGKWNLSQYKLISASNSNIEMICGSSQCRLLFYHFQGVLYLSEKKAKMNIFPSPYDFHKELVFLIYDNYFYKIGYVRRMLKLNYGISSVYDKHPGYHTNISFNHRILNFVQSIMSLKWKYFYRFSDCRKL